MNPRNNYGIRLHLELEELRGLQLGNHDSYPTVSVDYDLPTLNGIQGAYDEATLRWRVSGVDDSCPPLVDDALAANHPPYWSGGGWRPVLDTHSGGLLNAG